MRRFIGVIIVLGAWLLNAASAQTYFNERKTLHSGGVRLTSVIERGDKYYTAAGCVDSINSVGDGTFWAILGVRFTVWDKYGVVLRDTQYQRPDSGAIEVASNSMIELPDHTFLIPVDAVDTANHFKQMLFCFDSTARLLWYREYEKPAGYPIVYPHDFWRLVDFKADGKGSYLMLSTILMSISGSTATGSFYHKVLLTKLDSGFNIIWNKSYGDNLLNSIAGKLIIEPDGYTLGGYYSNENRGAANLNGYSYQAEIFKTDTAGVVQWHWKSDTTKLTGGTTDLIRTKDGAYAYCGMGGGRERLAGNGTLRLIDWLPWVEKISATGQPIWGKAIGDNATASIRNEFHKLRELPNGDLMVAGNIASGFELKDSLDFMHGVLVRLDAGGNIRWRRMYRYQDIPMLYYLNDMKQTADGGYIMCGEANDDYWNFDKRQRAWLLKVDSNGCTSGNDPQCWPTAVPNEPKLVAGSYKVYPNPATEQLQVSYNKENQADETFSLFDITGRRVKEAILSGQSKTITLDIGPFQSGMYFYRILNESGVLKAGGKLVKQ